MQILDLSGFFFEFLHTHVWMVLYGVGDVYGPHRVIYSTRVNTPIRTAENFEAVEWATGFSIKNEVLVGHEKRSWPVE